MAVRACHLFEYRFSIVLDAHRRERILHPIFYVFHLAMLYRLTVHPIHVHPSHSCPSIHVTLHSRTILFPLRPKSVCSSTTAALNLFISLRCLQKGMHEHPACSLSLLLFFFTHTTYRPHPVNSLSRTHLIPPPHTYNSPSYLRCHGFFFFFFRGKIHALTILNIFLSMAESLCILIKPFSVSIPFD